MLKCHREIFLRKPPVLKGGKPNEVLLNPLGPCSNETFNT